MKLFNNTFLGLWIKLIYFQISPKRLHGFSSNILELFIMESCLNRRWSERYFFALRRCLQIDIFLKFIRQFGRICQFIFQDGILRLFFEVLEIK